MNRLYVGDLVQIAWGKDTQVIGILLNIKQFSAPKMSMSYVKYSFEILELNGAKNWYDVWNGEDRPKLICSREQARFTDMT